jgi:hypothetical protein
MSTQQPEGARVEATIGRREALATMLAQFMHGEEISFTAVPIGLEHVTDEALRRDVQKQLEDEQRHHAMFEAERVRLNLPRESPNEPMLKFHDAVLGRLRAGDTIGAVMAGCFTLEGAAFSTLLTHSDVVDAQLGLVFREIFQDEARHIALNVSVVRDMVGDDPEKLAHLVAVHRETLPVLFSLFTSFREINRELGVDNDWFTMRCLFHHSQRIRRLRLPGEYGHVMLADTLALAGDR